MAGDNLKIFQLLDVPPHGILIKSIQLILFGKEIILDCLYNPDQPKDFKIRLENCSKLSWELYGELDERDTFLDPIDILFPDDPQQEPVTIFTAEGLEMIVWCKEVSVQKEW